MFSRACTYTRMIVQWLVGFPEVTGFKMLTTFFLDIILFLDGIPCMENHQACASEVGMRSIRKQEQIRRTHDFLMGNVNHLSVTGQILWAPQKTCTFLACSTAQLNQHMSIEKNSPWVNPYQTNGYEPHLDAYCSSEQIEWLCFCIFCEFRSTRGKMMVLLSRLIRTAGKTNTLCFPNQKSGWFEVPLPVCILFLSANRFWKGKLN